LPSRISQNNLDCGLIGIQQLSFVATLTPVRQEDNLTARRSVVKLDERQSPEAAQASKQSCKVTQTLHPIARLTD
jgi:hypothetical protein